ncbi:hypothetical protein Tco_0628944 [Tanacetum coccineum]|uniref:Uncharacterized protein n=1 Tax=Tanacetum coccineum TaxID=301880 RepID=A0ABQ4WRU9_9ASTR
MGEGSALPTDPHRTPTFIQLSTQPQKTQKPRKPKRKDTHVPQPSDPIENVADEAVHKELGDSLVRAATTASSLEAEQDCGGGPRCQETMGDTIAQTSSGLDLTYALTTITTQQPTEGELYLLFEARYDDYNVDTAPTPTNSSSQAINFPNTSHDVDELKTQQQHVQHQPATIADNVLNAIFNENTFVNPFATPSTSAAESSSSQYVDPSNMHTFYQPYTHGYQWTKDHPLE